MRPDDIEKRSMEIITRELRERGDVLRRYAPDELPVVMRAIHTTADFDFAGAMIFSAGAVAAGRAALHGGTPIVTDTSMALAGLSKPCAARFGNELVCRIAHEDTVNAAKAAGSTRAEAAMDYCAELYPNAVYAIGNAPTALLRLCAHVKSGKMRPALVIGAPVGFVNVVESKETLLSLDATPYIIASGRKGGSAVAAAVVNALYYGMV